ncbi:MAG: hypothetical protein A3F72_12100 [Bacteroidetes bacterium RIFCSPLOWO2_12_FULL_35_15]|nr:MAG: hypothetical protein A3F72_12100 [Bacteroidetes bacterium RIFCSPLOWO2_12_FULL_35_15]
MLKGLLHTHLLSVILFLLIYLVKTFLLLANKKEGLEKFTKMVKVPEMIISVLFLGTGIYLLMQFGLTKLLLIKIIAVFLSIPLAIIGFKKKNKVLASLAFLLIVASYGLAEVNKKRIERQIVNPKLADITNPDYNLVKHGEAVYVAYCQRCHGKGGTNGPGGLDLTVSITDRDTKINRVVIGTDLMAGFKDVLNSQEVEAVVAYVETLKK